MRDRHTGNCYEDIFHLGRSKYYRFPKYCVLASMKRALISRGERVETTVRVYRMTFNVMNVC